MVLNQFRLARVAPIMIDDQTAYEITDKIKAYRGVLKQLDLKFDRHNFKLRNLMDQNNMQ